MKKPDRITPLTEKFDMGVSKYHPDGSVTFDRRHTYKYTGMNKDNLIITPDYRVAPNIPRECTLTNAQLIAKAEEWIDKLCKSGGKSWSLRVPVDFNEDPDMIFTELIKRLSK